MKTTTIQLNVETETFFDRLTIKEIYHMIIKSGVYNMGGVYDELAPYMERYGYKYGRGGSHIWISNQSNKRLAIIEFRQVN